MPDVTTTATPGTADTVSLPLPETIAATGSPAPTTNPDTAPEIGGTPTPPSAAVIAPPAATAAAEAIAPMRWQPKRPDNWLGAILGTFRDAIAGHPTQIYTDASGNRYIGEANETSGQKWARIVANAARGAAAGYAAGQGPGGQGRAALAGMNVGMQQGQQQRQQTEQQKAELRQDMLDKFNSRMEALKYQEQVYRMTRLNVDATHEDWRFSKDRIEYALKQPGAVDLGAYEGPLDLHKIQERDPTAVKDFMAGKIEVIDEVNPNNKRAGMHYILHPTPMQERMAPKGSPTLTYMPSTSGDPKDSGKLIPSFTTQEMKESDRQAAILGEQKKKLDAEEVIHKKEMEDVNRRHVEQEIKEGVAKTAEAWANAAKTRSEIAQAAPAYPSTATTADLNAFTQATGITGLSPDVFDNAEGLASGRLIMGKDIPIRTTKEQTTAAAYNRVANAYSQWKYGIPYSPATIREEDHFATNPKVQAYLSGVDRMLGTGPDDKGQLNQVVQLARAAGLSDAAPLNTVKQAFKDAYGDEAARNFATVLSDTQKSLTVLIGNPLVGGGGDSDLKLKEAQKQFGANPTLKNLISSSGQVREVLERSRTDLARNNRYIQQRYLNTPAAPRPNQNPPAPGTIAAPSRPAEYPANYVYIHLSKPDAKGRIDGWVSPEVVKTLKQQDPGLQVGR